MYGTCSHPATFEAGTDSVPATPPTPGSPASFTSSSKEPLLLHDHNSVPFWHRVVSLKQNGSVNHAMNATLIDDDAQQDDQEIDDRSVEHYESGSCEKSSTRCFRGTLTFALRYDFIHRVLMVHVIRANHLPSEGNRVVEPYVKMYLLPERRNHCKTRICKKSLDPEFNEMFSFDVPFNNLANRMLQFTVYDFDRFTRHDLIGNVIMRDLFDKSDLCNWTEYTMQIVGSQGKDDFGDLLLYLAYSVCDQKLLVTVSKAYNLRPMDITGASDPYVKIEQIYQRRRVKLRKTSTKRANLNPVYHECLEFDVPLNEIDETNLLVQVMDWDRIGRDDLLGCCIIGCDSTTAEGRQQWADCFRSLSSTDQDPSRLRSVGTWHSILAEVPDEFRNIPKAKKLNNCLNIKT
uniref:C2 domain-containing protein n=2 Tax=Ascaris TaxID=6251 RepID=A0A0M3I323_ASCLU